MVSGILLGAGESKRMGKDKLVLPWGKSTVFEHCLQTLLCSELGEIVVVLSAMGNDLGNRIRRRPAFRKKKVTIVWNPFYKRGMSTSIRKGLQNLDSVSGGILIALGDQPSLKSKTVNALIHAFTPGEGKIVVPFYGRRRGNPVLFDRSYLKELMELKGDTGGRSVIDRHTDNITRVQTRSEAVIRDIDIWEDYTKLKARGKRQ
jgi:molybdenum cofactor cytidylyltransferase